MQKNTEETYQYLLSFSIKGYNLDNLDFLESKKMTIVSPKTQKPNKKHSVLQQNRQKEKTQSFHA
jgi:hypothetical protein